ncbi:MAG: hypothetical protein ABIK28_08575 [Planctomycetota bacterium]
MKPSKSVHFFAFILAFTGIFASGIASGQAAKDERRAEAARTNKILEERNREELHRDLPIKLSGLEQGDNSFRELTPSLLYSDGKAAIVDREELYNRKLAMYEKSRSFDTSLAVKDRVKTCSAEIKPRITPAGLFRQSPPTFASDNVGSWAMMAFPVVVGLILLMRWRRRRLLNTIEAENRRRRSMFGKSSF